MISKILFRLTNRILLAAFSLCQEKTVQWVRAKKLTGVVSDVVRTELVEEGPACCVQCLVGED